jgi:hypothetical protein
MLQTLSQTLNKSIDSPDIRALSAKFKFKKQPKIVNQFILGQQNLNRSQSQQQLQRSTARMSLLYGAGGTNISRFTATPAHESGQGRVESYSRDKNLSTLLLSKTK